MDEEDLATGLLEHVACYFAGKVYVNFYDDSLARGPSKPKFSFKMFQMRLNHLRRAVTEPSYKEEFGIMLSHIYESAKTPAVKFIDEMARYYFPEDQYTKLAEVDRRKLDIFKSVIAMGIGRLIEHVYKDEGAVVVKDRSIKNSQALAEFMHRTLVGLKEVVYVKFLRPEEKSPSDVSRILKHMSGQVTKANADRARLAKRVNQLLVEKQRYKRDFIHRQHLAAANERIRALTREVKQLRKELGSKKSGKSTSVTSVSSLPADNVAEYDYESDEEISDHESEPAKTYTPEPAKTYKPEPATKTYTPEPAKTYTPEPAKTYTPEPETVADYDFGGSDSPEKVKSPTPVTRRGNPLPRDF